MSVCLRVFLPVLLAATSVFVGSPGEAGSLDTRMRIVAYINATAGCQADTIRYLKDFAARHGSDVSLEVVDFGNETGFARWRRDGYNCETLVINGATQFRAGTGDKARIVVLKMPEGVRWTFEDLAAVLTQELKSPGSSVLSDSDAQMLARRTPVAWRAGRWQDKEVGEVVVAAQTVFRFAGSLRGISAVGRARESSSILKKLYDTGLQAGDVRVVSRGSGANSLGVVVAKDRDVATVTEAEARVLKRTPLQTARFWAFNLREAMRLLGR